MRVARSALQGLALGQNSNALPRASNNGQVLDDDMGGRYCDGWRMGTLDDSFDTGPVGATAAAEKPSALQPPNIRLDR